MKKVPLSKKDVIWNFTSIKESLGLHLLTCFQRVQYGKEEKRNFTVEESSKH